MRVVGQFELQVWADSGRSLQRPPMTASRKYRSFANGAGTTRVSRFAPVSVVDPETRNHFGEQIDQFNQSVRRVGSDRPD